MENVGGGDTKPKGYVTDGTEANHAVVRRKTTRENYVDVYRGIGIILMIMGHVGIGQAFDHWIHAFHMPMFFFCSGYFFKGNEEISFKEECIRKGKTLLVPYFSFGIFHWLVYLIKNQEFTVKPLLHVCTINTNGMPIAGGLWFLTSLFLVDVIYFSINRLNISEKMKSLIICGCVGVGMLLPMLLPFRLPWAFDTALVGIGFYYIARLMHMYEEKREIHFLLNMPVYLWVMMAVANIVFIFLNGYVNMLAGKYAIWPLFYLNALSGILILVNMAKYLMKLEDVIVCGAILKLLQSIGKNSLVYLCLNQVVIRIVKEIVSCFVWNVFYKKIIIIFFTIMLLFCFDIVIRRTRLKIVIGK